jgi:hypothetical protein
MQYAAISEKNIHIYNCPILCCIFSFTVWYALMIVCSLMMISVVSAFGLLTLEAIVVESVSTMILHPITVS